MQARYEQQELVATRSRHGVADAQGFCQTPAELLEKSVAGRMSQGVVDGLEAIDVEKHHSERLCAALGVCDGLVQAAQEERAVGKSRERVVVGEKPDLPLAFLLRQHSLAERFLHSLARR